MVKAKPKRNYKAKTFEERKKEIDDLTAGMEAQIPEYFKSPESVKEYLDFIGKFHHYSSNNSALINSQFRGAEAVGSFNFWKEKGFNVQKGEKGIKVLVPKVTTYFSRGEKDVQLKYATAAEKQRIQNKEIPVQKRTFFGIGHVFDVSQTNATSKDLPEVFPNRWLEGSVSNYETMYQALEKVADKHGIAIVEPLHELGVAKGASYTMEKKVTLNPRNSELQNVKTLAHELAHAVLHNAETHKEYTSQEKEFQAEMVAYTVASYFDLDTTEYSLPYLHHWTEGKELKDQERLLKEVRDTAHDFISTIEEDLTKERERFTEFEKGLNHDTFYGEALVIQENMGLLSNVVEWDNEEFLHYLKDTSPEDYKKFQACKAYHEKIQTENDVQKDILLIEYGSLSNTENSYVSKDELKVILEKEQKGLDKSWSDKELIGHFNEVFQERYAAVDSHALDRPSVLIQWSESPELESNSIEPYCQANLRMEQLESASQNEIGYYKTRYHVLFPKELSEDGAVHVVNMDRLDIGDGYYVNPHHQVMKETKLPPVFREALDNEIMNDLLAKEDKEIKDWAKTNRKAIAKEMER